MLVGVVLLTTFLAAPFLTPLGKYLSIPNQIVTFDNHLPINVPELGNNINVDASDKTVQTAGSGSKEFTSSKTGKTNLMYEVAGLPIKKVDVSVLDDLKVVPSGESIGVKLHTKGVLVVGFHRVQTKKGSKSPAEDADIKAGDIILKINGDTIEKMGEVKPYVKKAAKKDKPLQVTVKRGDEKFETELEPAKDKKSEPQIGLYIRDSSAGIGTMTFHEPKSGKYGALGHVISDMDTKKPVDVLDGSIVESKVKSIEKGNNGNPGEKQATFSPSKNKIGTIKKNSPYGIFGELTEKTKDKEKALPIALGDEVEEGPAKILTVIEGDEVEEFDVEVVSSVPQKRQATKGLIIKVTDEELLEKTGGIVQGMSGSPIIQDGKVIGAVTHVFVNDSTSGYGVHIEWMLRDAGIDIYKNEEEAS